MESVVWQVVMALIMLNSDFAMHELNGYLRLIIVILIS